MRQGPTHRHLMTTAGVAMEGGAKADTNVRVVVAFPAGSATDTIMRVLGPRIMVSLGRPVVIDNRAGAGGISGSEMIARGPRDGCSPLMAAASSYGIMPAIMPRILYDAVSDFTPIGLACTSTNFMVVYPSLPVHNLQELIAFAKAQGLPFAGGSRGSSNRLAGEMLALHTGAPLTHVPYNNIAQAITDTVGGHLKMMIYTVALMPHVQAGRLRAIAVTSAKQRQAQAPDVPTALDKGADGVVADSWFAKFGPAGLPGDIRELASAALRGLWPIPRWRSAWSARGWRRLEIRRLKTRVET